MVDRSVRLSNGPGPAGRVIGVVVGAVFAGGGLLFAAMTVAGDRFMDDFPSSGQCTDPSDLGGIPADALPPEVTVCSGFQPAHLGALGVAGLVVGAGLVLLGLFIAARSVRAATWLDGTVLRVRGAFRSRTVDLATADVTVGTVTHADDEHRQYRVPTLVARDPVSGRRVQLPLSGAGLDRLPPAELRAIAEAVSAGRPGSQVDAAQVASHLRQMADNPLDLPAR
jgi:hypothetical protein